MNTQLHMTLDEAVDEVLSSLNGLDLTYVPEFSKYYAVTRMINKALRVNATEVEWSYYSAMEDVGVAALGMRELALRGSVRPRLNGDDSVQFVDADGVARVWAYFLPRDSIGKYPSRNGLWASVTRNKLVFSRPLGGAEAGLNVRMPVMREPTMFRLPARPEDPYDPVVTVPAEVREQLLDFDYPDLVLYKAAQLVAESDPVLQPRVQAMEAAYKDLMYQLKERDEKNTDAPFQNEFFVPIQSSLYGAGNGSALSHGHPHSDERQW